MWVIKSIGLGLLTVLAALFVVIATILIVLVVVSARMASSSGGGIGWDVVSFVHQQPLIPVLFVTTLCLLFALGFGAGYHRYGPRF